MSKNYYKTLLIIFTILSLYDKFSYQLNKFLIFCRSKKKTKYFKSLMNERISIKITIRLFPKTCMWKCNKIKNKIK